MVLRVCNCELVVGCRLGCAAGMCIVYMCELYISVCIHSVCAHCIGVGAACVCVWLQSKTRASLFFQRILHTFAIVLIWGKYTVINSDAYHR